jgi:hypothetical protein
MIFAKGIGTSFLSVTIPLMLFCAIAEDTERTRKIFIIKVLTMGA